MCESLVRSWRDRVVFPAPDGEDRTSIRPRRWISGVSASFDILDLLAHALDGALQIDADARQLDVGRLRTQRIGLAVELLAEEIEFAPYRIVGPRFLQEAARLGDMGGQTVEFLAYICLADQQRHFLGEALLRQRGRPFQEIEKLALESRADH